MMDVLNHSDDAAESMTTRQATAKRRFGRLVTNYIATKMIASIYRKSCFSLVPVYPAHVLCVDAGVEAAINDVDKRVHV